MKRPILVIAIVFVFAAVIGAHPPSAINVTVDLKTLTVKAEIIHKVKDARDHFIHEIAVKVNGKKLIKQDATEQINAEKQTVSYVVPGLKAGDVIAVTGDCNKIGDLTVEYTVKAAAAKPEPKETGKPSDKPEANASSKFRVK